MRGQSLQAANVYSPNDSAILFFAVPSVQLYTVATDDCNVERYPSSFHDRASANRLDCQSVCRGGTRGRNGRKRAWSATPPTSLNYCSSQYMRIYFFAELFFFWGMQEWRSAGTEDGREGMLLVCLPGPDSGEAPQLRVFFWCLN